MATAPTSELSLERRFRVFCVGYTENQPKPRAKRSSQADYGYDGSSQEQVDRIEEIKHQVDAKYVDS